MTRLGISLHVKKGIKYKQTLITALVLVLALPSLEQPFHLFVNVNKGIAPRVLTQKHGGQRQCVAFLSKFLDPVTQGWPECIQAIVGIALLTKEGRKITFG
jgi:dolichol kinase